MTKFQKWMLRKIAKSVVIQGVHHQNVVEFYTVLQDAAGEEFTEDNKPTLTGFLKDCHNQALTRMK